MPPWNFFWSNCHFCKNHHQYWKKKIHVVVAISAGKLKSSFHKSKLVLDLLNHIPSPLVRKEVDYCLISLLVNRFLEPFTRIFTHHQLHFWQAGRHIFLYFSQKNVLDKELCHVTIMNFNRIFLCNRATRFVAKLYLTYVSYDF